MRLCASSLVHSDLYTGRATSSPWVHPATIAEPSCQYLVVSAFVPLHSEGVSGSPLPFPPFGVHVACASSPSSGTWSTSLPSLYLPGPLEFIPGVRPRTPMPVRLLATRCACVVCLRRATFVSALVCVQSCARSAMSPTLGGSSVASFSRPRRGPTARQPSCGSSWPATISGSSMPTRTSRRRTLARTLPNHMPHPKPALS